MITIAYAPQTAAPALRAGIDGSQSALFTWIGSDGRGVHQDSRHWDNGALSDPVTLPLPPTAPYDQSLHASIGGYSHLLWRDRDEAEGGELRLYAALLSQESAIERGPTPVSTMNTFDYAAAADAQGGLWIAWTGGNLAHPALFTQYLDPAGRPRPPVLIARNTSFPSFSFNADSGKLYLFWLQDSQLIRAELAGGIPLATFDLTSSVGLSSGDRLYSLYAAQDGIFGYVFWNITRASGAVESWLATGEMDAPYWQQPFLLGMSNPSSTPMNVGFNLSAYESRYGENPVIWVSPLNSVRAPLPVAGIANGDLSLLFFQHGELAAAQSVVHGVTLAAPPILRIDRLSQLYLAWAALDTAMPAALNFIFTP